MVRILATPSAIAESLLEDIAAFMREPRNREIKVNIEECVTSELLRSMREGSSAIGVCWNHTDLGDLQQLSYRKDRLALAVHDELRYEDTLDDEHVGMRPDSAVVIMLQRAAHSWADRCATVRWCPILTPPFGWSRPIWPLA